MLKIFNRLLLFSYHKPKIMNISNLLKKQALADNNTTATITQKSKEGTQQHFSKIKNTADQSLQKQMSLMELQKVMSSQGQSLSRTELQINHQIKIQTKSNNLYELYRQKYLAFTTKNLVNLLVKVMELRFINKKQSQQTEKFDKMIKNITKKLKNFSPEDMIRLLFSIKKVDMNNADIKRIHPLISSILNEFNTRSVIKGYDTHKTYESFEVISIESSLKLVHSLHHLHSISGRQFEPNIVQLIGHCLQYFHMIVRNYLNKTEWQGVGKKIKWPFYFAFVNLSIRYKMPLQNIMDFLKALYPHKKSYLGKHGLLIEVAANINTFDGLMVRRGQKIKQLKELFYIYEIIYENIDKPQEMIKMKPVALLKHIDNLNQFTEQELDLLDFRKMKENTFLKILQFTIKSYQKYYTKDYLTELQKSSIENWIHEASQNHTQYLGKLLLEFHKSTTDKSFTNTTQFSKLVNVCLQWFSELSFNAKAVLLFISFQRGFKNTKIITDIFFNIDNQDSRQAKYFRKHQQIESYMRLFQFWPQIIELSKQTFDDYRQGTFIKLFFNSIIYLPNIQLAAHLFMNRIVVQREFMDLLVKKFLRFSQQNRSLSKNFINLVQQQQFKEQLKQIDIVLKNQRQDTYKLSSYVRVKYRLRQKIKRCLSAFKFFIILLQTLHLKQGKAQQSIVTSDVFKQILADFNDDLMCLYFKQLFTQQIYVLASQISKYLEYKLGRQIQCKIYDICKLRDELEIQVSLQYDTGCLKFIPQVIQKNKNNDKQ